MQLSRQRLGIEQDKDTTYRLVINMTSTDKLHTKPYPTIQRALKIRDSLVSSVMSVNNILVQEEDKYFRIHVKMGDIDLHSAKLNLDNLIKCVDILSS